MPNNELSKLNYIDEIRCDYVCLSHECINIMECFEKVRTVKAGAISSFIGTTRDNFEGKDVTFLKYEAYEEMALLSLLEICKSARKMEFDEDCNNACLRTFRCFTSKCSDIHFFGTSNRFFRSCKFYHK